MGVSFLYLIEEGNVFCLLIILLHLFSFGYARLRQTKAQIQRIFTPIFARSLIDNERFAHYTLLIISWYSQFVSVSRRASSPYEVTLGTFCPVRRQEDKFCQDECLSI